MERGGVEELNSKLPGWAKSLLGLAWLLVLVLVVHRKVVLEDAVYYRLDALRMCLPQRAFMVSELAAGRFPLWLPYEALGLPFFAQLAPGVLHPLNLVYLALPLGRAFAWNSVLATLTAAVGAWVLVRSSGGSRWAALVAGSAFGLSGPLVTQSNLHYLVANATMPWAVAGLWCFERRRTPGALLAAAAGVSLVFTAGDPQGVMVAFAFGLAGVLGQASGQRAAGVARLALVGLTVGLVAAVQLVPSLEALVNGVRGGRDLSGLEKWSLVPLRLLELFCPNLVLIDGDFLELEVLPYMPWTPSVYLGGGVLVLAAHAAWVDRSSRGLALLGGLLLWAALGPAFGLNTLVGHVVPVWKSFQFTEKLVPFVTLAVSILGGRGLDRLLAAPQRGSVPALAAVSSVTVVVIFAVSRWAAEGVLVGVVEHLLFSSMLGALPVLVVWAAWRSRAWWQPAVLAAAVSLPPTWVNAMPELTAPEAFALSVPWVAQRLAADHTAPTPPRLLAWLPQGPDKPLPLVLVRAALMTPHNLQFGIEALTAYHPFIPLRFHAAVAPSSDGLPDLRLSRIFGTEYVVHRTADGDLAGWDRVAEHRVEETSLTLARSRQALPRVFVAPAVESVPDERTAAAQVRSPDFAPGHHVLVDCAVSAEDRVREVRGAANISSWASDAVEVTASLTKPGYVVLNDTWYPGWEARVDGVRATICLANGAVRAVKVPAGQHVVSFQYAPWTFTAGAWLSALSVVTLLGLELRRLRRGAGAT